MSTIVTVAKVDELQDSTMREVLVQGHEILLARVLPGRSEEQV